MHTVWYYYVGTITLFLRSGELDGANEKAGVRSIRVATNASDPFRSSSFFQNLRDLPRGMYCATSTRVDVKGTYSNDSLTALSHLFFICSDTHTYVHVGIQ